MNTRRIFITKTVIGVGIFTLAALLFTACGSKPKMFTVGVLNLSTNIDPAVEGFKAGMTEHGYIEGQNIKYIYNGATGSVDAMDAALDEIMANDVDLIFSLSTPGTTKTKAAVETTDIPVVFSVVIDAVGANLIESLTHPGGNLTGVQIGGSIAKQLSLLQAMAPGTTRIFMPHNPEEGGSIGSMAEVIAAAPGLGIEPVVVGVHTQEEIIAALAMLPEDVDAIFLLGSGFLNQQIANYVSTANQHLLPLISMCYCTEQGVLMSYGYDFFRVGEQSARLADQILKGTPAGDLPVETADFFLSINLQTAQAIGLEIPDEVLAQADDIVR